MKTILVGTGLLIAGLLSLGDPAAAGCVSQTLASGRVTICDMDNNGSIDLVEVVDPTGNVVSDTSIYNVGVTTGFTTTSGSASGGTGALCILPLDEDGCSYGWSGVGVNVGGMGRSVWVEDGSGYLYRVCSFGSDAVGNRCVTVQ